MVSIFFGSLSRRTIVSAALTKNDVVLEVGPGLGVLTAALARQAGLVIAVEIDRALLPLLDETLREYDNVRLVEGDACKVDFGGLLRDYAPTFTGSCKVVGNLPYYITSPLIMHLLYGSSVRTLVFMVQKRLQRAQLLLSRKDYGVLSIAPTPGGTCLSLSGITADLPAPVASSVIKLTSAAAGSKCQG